MRPASLEMVGYYQVPISSAVDIIQFSFESNFTATRIPIPETKPWGSGEIQHPAGQGKYP